MLSGAKKKRYRMNLAHRSQYLEVTYVFAERRQSVNVKAKFRNIKQALYPLIKYCGILF